MMANRELQRRAQAQANSFKVARETAQAQLKTLQAQQATVAKLLEELNAKLAETDEERQKKEQELAIAQARLDGIARIRNQTEQTFVQLVTLEKLNLAQAELEQQIAQARQENIDAAVQARMERDALELDSKRKETTAKIEQLRQLQAEDELRQSINQVRVQQGLATLEPTEDLVQLQTQLAGLLTSLKDLETQQPELPADVKAALAEAQGDIHQALQGKETANMQANLLKAMAAMIGQIDQYAEINRIELEEKWNNQLLATAQTDLQTASRDLLKELERANQLGGEQEVINPLYMEALTKVALAQQAVDISEDLAKEGKEALEQIIKQRIEQRKARKKAFWMKILGIVSTVLSLLGTVLTFIPGTTAIGLALGAISGAIGVVQSAISGDWMGAIFSAVMVGANFVGGTIGNALKAGKTIILGMGKLAAQKVLSTIKVFQSLASGAFNGVRNILSGDKIMGFLYILQGLAGAATSGISGFIQGGLQSLSDIGKFGYKVLESLTKAPTLIYGGIKAIQSGDWVKGISNLIKGAVSLAKTWTNDFNDDNESPGEKIANILENISAVGIGVSKFITGGLEGLLEGLGDILEGLGDDIVKFVEEKLKPSCGCVDQQNTASEIKEKVEAIDQLSASEQLNSLEQLDPATREQVLKYLREKYGNQAAWERTHQLDGATSDTSSGSLLGGIGQEVVTDIPIPTTGASERQKVQQVGDLIWKGGLAISPLADRLVQQAELKYGHISVSGHRCLNAVQNILDSVGVSTKPVPHAYQFPDAIQEGNFNDYFYEFDNSFPLENLPNGSIIVFNKTTGHPSGHIEIKAATSQHPTRFISDYQQFKRINYYGRPAHIYVPFQTSNEYLNDKLIPDFKP